MDLTISTIAQRPELLAPMWEMKDSWAEFMRHDPVGNAHVGRIPEVFPDFAHVATDESGAVVARALSVPFALRGQGRGDGELPARGWDQVLAWAFRDQRCGVAPDTVSAIEITVDPALRGRGVSAVMLSAMRAGAAAHGFAEVVAPVRPSAKHVEPGSPMAEYAARTRPDGLPHDPWLRVHVRAGGAIDSVATVSMVVPGTLAEWRTWTGLPFDAPGPVDVPGALNAVHCDLAGDYAVYVEPNVWVRHPLDDGE
jgi:GNAT superfamily N-acetyltransferase